MPFLNPILLFALTSVSVPIVIHLLNQTIRPLNGQIMLLADVRLLIDKSQIGSGEVRMVWPETKVLKANLSGDKLAVEPLTVQLHTILTVS